jgi:hypothetical protein
MKYVALAVVCLALILIPSASASAQGPMLPLCEGPCAFFHMAFGAIPTTGDPAADIAGLIALGSTLMTLARMVQAATIARGAAPFSDSDDGDAESGDAVADPVAAMPGDEADHAETGQEVMARRIEHS